MITIIMTGGTSGFGKIAADQLKSSSYIRLLLGIHSSRVSTAFETIPLDLSKLESVRFFATRINELLGTTKIDALVFNAGVSLPNDNNRTDDGFEKTFAVNHLAHYLLLRLLEPKLADKAKVILTTSGTHDPDEKTIIPPPRHADAKLLAHPDLDPDHDKNDRIAGGRAYSSSKLCVILTARAFALLPKVQNRQISIVAYDPGPTPGTGLVRNTNLFIRMIWYILGTSIFHPFLQKMNNRLTAGSTLADLSLGKIKPPEGRIYAALRNGKLTWPDPSDLALRNDLMNTLWKDSSKLVGLPE